MTDDWTPEKEEEDDPIKLQKEQLAIGKEFLERLKKQEAEEQKRREEYEARPAAPVAYGTIHSDYKPPTFEEISANIKKAWDEVERVIPDAPDSVKTYAFQGLYSSFLRGPYLG